MHRWLVFVSLLTMVGCGQGLRLGQVAATPSGPPADPRGSYLVVDGVTGPASTLIAVLLDPNGAPIASSARHTQVSSQASVLSWPYQDAASIVAFIDTNGDGTCNEATRSAALPQSKTARRLFYAEMATGSDCALFAGVADPNATYNLTLYANPTSSAAQQSLHIVLQNQSTGDTLEDAAQNGNSGVWVLPTALHAGEPYTISAQGSSIAVQCSLGPIYSDIALVLQE